MQNTERQCERCGRWYEPDDKYGGRTYCPECRNEISMILEDEGL